MDFEFYDEEGVWMLNWWTLSSAMKRELSSAEAKCEGAVRVGPMSPRCWQHFLFLFLLAVVNDERMLGAFLRMASQTLN